MPYNSKARKKRLPQDPAQWPREVKERLYAQIVSEEALARARDLEAQGARAWYTEMFGVDSGLNQPLIWDELAAHHIEGITWHWTNLIFRRAGMDITEYAYFAIWPRGHMKSTIARYIAIADACLTQIGYCLYVSGTQDKVRGHAISIEGLLAGKKVKEYYPDLQEVKRGLSDQSKGWTADFIYTKAGYVFHFVSLDQGVAGANIDSVRPTLIIPDDVDDRNASPVVSEKRLMVLTSSVIPTRQKGTLLFWAQNYINRHTVLYEIDTGRKRVLTRRKSTKPIPALLNMVTEVQTINGIPTDVITAGTPTWAWYDIARCQEEMDNIGLEAFLRECQHEVEQDKSGLVLPEYDEAVHIITWEEFNAVYGLPSINRTVPAHWRRYIGHDWGSSGVEQGHGNVVAMLSTAAHNGPLPSTVFLYRAMTFQKSTVAGIVARSILEEVLAPNQADPMKYIELELLDRASADPGDRLAVETRRKVIDVLSQLPYALWHMSHEAKAVRDIYRLIYGLPMISCNPGKDGGVEQLRHYLRADYRVEHPFRYGAKGLARMYIIVENEEQRRTPKGDAGMELVRTQLTEWRWRPPTLTAKGFMDERPMKVDDDVGNALMMVFTHFKLAATPLTEAERLVAAIPPALRYENLLANSPFEKGLTPEQELAHLVALKEAAKQCTGGIEYFDEYGQRVK